MIDIFLPDTTPKQEQIGGLHKQTANVISTPKAFNCFNTIVCNFEPDYTEDVFANPAPVAGTSEFQNDRSDIALKQLSTTSDTVEIKIFKNDIELATITNDTYGDYFGTGDFTSGLKVGFIADWLKIFNEEGAAHYHFTINSVIAGEVIDETTHKYILTVYDSEFADGTVVIKTRHFGYVENGIDYTEIVDGWERQVRLRGNFGRPDFGLDIEDYQTTTRKLKQIQVKLTEVYTLEFKLLPKEVILPFMRDRLLANDIQITSHDTFAFFGACEPIDVAPIGIEESNYFPRNSRGKYILTFRDRFQDGVKRNFI